MVCSVMTSDSCINVLVCVGGAVVACCCTWFSCIVGPLSDVESRLGKEDWLRNVSHILQSV